MKSAKLELQKFQSFSGGASTFIADGNNSALVEGRGMSQWPFESSTGELSVMVRTNMVR